MLFASETRDGNPACLQYRTFNKWTPDADWSHLLAEKEEPIGTLAFFFEILHLLSTNGCVSISSVEEDMSSWLWCQLVFCTCIVVNAGWVSLCLGHCVLCLCEEHPFVTLYSFS